MNKRKLLALMVGIYAALDSAQTVDWLANYEPKRWESSLAVTKDIMLLLASVIIYSLSRTRQRLNVHVIRSDQFEEKKEEKEQKTLSQKIQPRYSSFNDQKRSSADLVQIPLSRDSLADSPPVEIVTQSLPSIT